MVNRPRAKGTAAESILVEYLRTNGWPYAERRSLNGALDKGDVAGCPGLVWECKVAGFSAGGGTRLNLGPWLTETGIERLNARADHGILVVKPYGMGEKSVPLWYAVMVASDFDRLKITVEEQVNMNLRQMSELAPLFIVDGPPTTYTAATLRWSLNTANKAPVIAPNEALALTLRPPGTREKPENWYRVMNLSDMVRALRTAGYGEPLTSVV